MVCNASSNVLYLNGAQQSFNSQTSNVGDWFGDLATTNSPDYQVGTRRNNGADGLFCDGEIDDVRVYSRALTTSEISAIYDDTTH